METQSTSGGSQTSKEQAWGRFQVASAAAAMASSMALAGTASADATQQKVSTLKDPLILYQYQVCPWCCKVKAVLDFHKVPYRTIEVNPVWKDELKFSADYKKVPIVITTDGEQLNESNVIIDYIMNNLVSDKSPKKKGWFGGAKPATVSSQEEKDWRDWVDTKFVQLITANIYSSWGQARQSMAYISDNANWSTMEKFMASSLGAVAMYFVGKRMPKKYGIEGDLRENLYIATDSFVAAVGDREFMGGKQPNLADLAVFGVIRAVQDTDTFYDLLAHTAVQPWWFRMVETVGESSQVVGVDQ